MATLCYCVDFTSKTIGNMTLVKILDTAYQYPTGSVYEYFFCQMRSPSQNWAFSTLGVHKKMQTLESFNFPTYFLQRHGKNISTVTKFSKLYFGLLN